MKAFRAAMLQDQYTLQIQSTGTPLLQPGTQFRVLISPGKSPWILETGHCISSCRSGVPSLCIKCCTKEHAIYSDLYVPLVILVETTKLGAKNQT